MLLRFVQRLINRKLSVLLRMSKFLCLDKRRTVFKSFIESQFKYCPLIWMLCSRSSNKKINRLHERALRLVYDDYSSSFETLLERDSSFTIIYFIYIFHLLFKFRQSQFPLELKIPFCNSVYHGKNSIRYFGP